MFVSYSENTKEIEIAGNKDELVDLSKNLLKDNAEIFLHSEKLDPSPYSTFLKKIRVQIIPNHLIEFQVIGEFLSVKGSYEKLLILAENIENFGNDGDKGDHIHIEYFQDHFYLSPESNPLVLLHL
jgi:hypothetical protein